MIDPMKVLLWSVQEALLRRQARKNFGAFCRYILRETVQDFVFADFHRFLADALGKLATGSGLREMVFAPPQHGKSQFSSIALPAFVIGTNPAQRIIVLSHSNEKAQEFGRAVRDIIASPAFMRLFPRVRLAPDSSAAGRFDVEKRTNLGRWVRCGKCFFVGDRGSVTGRGADLIIVDDLIKGPEDAFSQKRRDTTWTRFLAVAMTRLGSDKGRILILNTRWHTDDICGRLLAKQPGRWHITKLPAIAGLNDPMGRKPGVTLWPERFGLAYFNEVKEIGSRIFSALYQQEPVPDEGNIINPGWIRHWRTLPEEWDEIIQSWDLRFTAKTDRGAYVVGQVWGMKGPYRYLLDQMRERAGFVRSKEMMRELSDRWPGAMRKLVEEAANGDALEDDLRTEIPGIKLWPPQGDKSARLQAVSGAIESGHVLFPPSSKEYVRDFVDRLIAFPDTEFKDEIDSLSQALAYFQSKKRGVGVLAKK